MSKIQTKTDLIRVRKNDSKALFICCSFFLESEFWGKWIPGKYFLIFGSVMENKLENKLENNLLMFYFSQVY